MIDVDKDCEAPEVKAACPDFKSSPENYGKNDTRKNGLILYEGTKCTMTIDASAAVARVMVTEANQIGVLFNEYDREKWITIPQGNIQEITIYNGKELGP